MRKPPKMSKADRQVQEAADAATWDAIEADRRQALEDDLAWIAKGRAKTQPDTGDRKNSLRRPL